MLFLIFLYKNLRKTSNCCYILKTSIINWRAGPKSGRGRQIFRAHLLGNPLRKSWLRLWPIRLQYLLQVWSKNWWWRNVMCIVDLMHNNNYYYYRVHVHTCRVALVLPWTVGHVRWSGAASVTWGEELYRSQYQFSLELTNATSPCRYDYTIIILWYRGFPKLTEIVIFWEDCHTLLKCIVLWYYKDVRGSLL